MIYFDNSATTLPHPDVVKAFGDVASQFFGNPSSLHHLGGKSAQLLDQARKVAADCLGVQPGEIVFTSGGTESNNAALKGVAIQHRSRGKHIITSSIEHASVYETCKQLEELGYSVTYLPTDDKGRVRPEDVQRALSDDTILVSVMYVNSELGTVQPIEEIGRILSAYPKTYFHVDAVQGFGKLPLMPGKWGIDLLSLSAHKFHGVRGCGLLYVRRGVMLSPLIIGGGQEGGLRSGTENVPGIVAMAKAMRMQHERLQENHEHMKKLRARLIDGLLPLEYCKLNGPGKDDAYAAPHIVNVSFPGIKAEVVLHALEKEEIYVSTRSACSSKNSKPSRVLLAAGIDEERARSALRISFSPDNTEAEVDVFIRAIQKIVPNLAKIMRV
ncbi:MULTISPECIES: cysteine desulfurase family protein [Aneurinibacillus]|uniref:Cysteine desulfurase n=1 Tax=Aneurinibacillus thermoaerophilus TaxID=143495 RepID=A0A1G7YPM8_ANETH|nr:MULTISPECIES: cysteine desulfurase family protein [Aneurinibacillus]AMA73796.1 cysteine desulfurase [Aneurinibacillus sp. XH2]MED0676626.1 cysteine desulfurase family protein [Aneurinibacillus thermoaerophilus]MED0679387.1 cysteine desulfurase family protein [Aneurinibacillus thermoaerophilus]MED0738042.1 cysteine desulfurase family protein [Aneurinibacillus thermoaerophilus]MED0756463.1 cysteine desulfurase family protein [Aneurinibacillus thermoaerophilus]